MYVATGTTADCTHIVAFDDLGHTLPCHTTANVMAVQLASVLQRC